MPLLSFYTSGKHQKSRGFLMLSGAIERDQPFFCFFNFSFHNFRCCLPYSLSYLSRRSVWSEIICDN